MTIRRSKHYTTSTESSDGSLVPWLAAHGPLAYSPEAPPSRDSSFQYGWALPQVCRPGTRRHLYFGAPCRTYAEELFRFWANARLGRTEPVALELGRAAAHRVDAPIAVYRHRTILHGDHYLLMQHGSYQSVPVDEQPELEKGYLLLHRGIGDATEFRFPMPWVDPSDHYARAVMQPYLALQREILSRSDLSFNSIHDRAKRVETSHILDDTWMTDDLARERGLDIEHDTPLQRLYRAAHQSFALCAWVSTHKFGPSRVVFRTPLANVRITSFFAGEHEARMIDPQRAELVEAVGCRMQWQG